MPFHETTPNALLEKANEERCLVRFLDQPLTYCLSDEFDLIIDYYHVDDLPSELHEWTFQLVKSNLHNLYVQSQMGWDDTHKRKEMLESRTRYLIARSRTNPSDLKGFLSFQLLQEETMDDDIMANTAYCFEIQLEPHARSKGLGEYLMNLLWEIGCYWKMDKVMLTVFKANQGAFRFYTEKLGFKLDEISPSACLPLYKAKKFDYELLNTFLKRLSFLFILLLTFFIIMDAEQIRDGVKNMQQGDKAASKGLFRKPDWDLAASCYERAATSFKIAKSSDQAVQAYIKASDALSKADATHLAGKALENAAFILAHDLNQPQRAAELYQRASNYFMTQGSIDRAAEQLEKAGRALENVDVNASYDMYSKACTIYEQEDRGRFAVDIFKRAVSLLIRNKKYDKAIEMLKRQSIVLQKFTSRSHLYKANLSILILIFAIGDDVEAGKQFSYMCGSDAGFAQSEEAQIAQDLLQAYEERDQELLERTVRLQHVTFLDNEVVKLARLLTVPGEVLSSTTTSPRKGNYTNPSRKVPDTHVPDMRSMSHAEARAELYSNHTGRSAASPAVDEKDGLSKDFSNLRTDDYYSDEDEEGLR